MRVRTARHVCYMLAQACALGVPRALHIQPFPPFSLFSFPEVQILCLAAPARLLEPSSTSPGSAPNPHQPPRPAAPSASPTRSGTQPVAPAPRGSRIPGALPRSPHTANTPKCLRSARPGGRGGAGARARGDPGKKSLCEGCACVLTRRHGGAAPLRPVCSFFS